MITRLVKLTFRADAPQNFLDEVFHDSKEKIRAVDGCEGMALLRDVNNPNVYFTRSYWQSEAHLEAYRQSELFKGVWAKTKVLFAEKAEAWTTEVVDE